MKLSKNKERAVGEEKKSQAGLTASENLVIHSSELFGEKKLVLIEHCSNMYRLMITKQGKLILTK